MKFDERKRKKLARLECPTSMLGREKRKGILKSVLSGKKLKMSNCKRKIS